MTVDIAPKAAEPARARMEGVKSDRLKTGGGQGSDSDAGGFAATLSEAVAVEDPAESATNAAAATTLATQPEDKPILDMSAMLALLVGVPASATATAKSTVSGTDIPAPEPVGSGNAAGVQPLIAEPNADGDEVTAAAPGRNGNPTGTAMAALSASGKVDGHWGARAGGRSEPASPNFFAVAGRADGLATEPTASGKAGAALALGTAPSASPGASVAAVPAGSANQTGSTLAALLSGGKGDGRGGGRGGGGSESMLPVQFLALGRLEDTVRAPGSRPDKTTETSGQPLMWGASPGASPAADAGAGLSAVSETPALQISDAMLADTVSYWVAQGVQSAELTLDGMGGEPIEVSIQLANGEAQIGFRSDLPETRQVIEGALAQLKDSLASQGLVLAGVSVGTSSRQDGSAGEPQRRPGSGRLRGINLTDAETMHAMPRPAGPMGRTLDLFA